MGPQQYDPNDAQWRIVNETNRVLSERIEALRVEVATGIAEAFESFAKQVDGETTSAVRAVTRAFDEISVKIDALRMRVTALECRLDQLDEKRS